VHKKSTLVAEGAFQTKNQLKSTRGMETTPYPPLLFYKIIGKIAKLNSDVYPKSIYL
jgi:hypothetical protein